MPNLESGLNSWRWQTNHNRMIAFQEAALSPKDGPVELAYFGSSAFRITSPAGISVMIDPWRNHPARKWDWYFADFPLTAVDIGVSTHAHFDHDALHRLDASVLLDRLIGTYQFGDVKITGIADKHATDSSAAIYDSKRLHRELYGVDIDPPNNPRSWDHCLILVETGGLRILHWGDNRPAPPAHIWTALGAIDVVLLPIDGSEHVMGYSAIESVIERLRPKIVVPHHYYIWNVVQRQSTLQPADDWVAKQVTVIFAEESKVSLIPKGLVDYRPGSVIYFGQHVAFDAVAWRTAV
jgi:L-ascorbate metabolism protein UlaG (beta-lactamase superfamily)